VFIRSNTKPERSYFLFFIFYLPFAICHLQIGNGYWSLRASHEMVDEQKIETRK